MNRKGYAPVIVKIEINGKKEALEKRKSERKKVKRLTRKKVLKK